MRPAMSVIAILFVSLLASTARGIRWEGHHVVASTNKVSSKEGYLGEEKVQCRDGEPCPGRNRKALMVKTSREIVPPSSSKSNDKKTEHCSRRSREQRQRFAALQARGRLNGGSSRHVRHRPNGLFSGEGEISDPQLKACMHETEQVSNMHKRIGM
ncbi:hypothetical protein HPP92_016618 [Vanilla planifolia]|uniref:Secreted protein n=1 Tax=Vanilla planifolia TaxID=51239 RepID=A0A835US87_VANPL|nr:hypothetical protein HPP92_016618 [Vanilla planifolia]